MGPKEKTIKRKNNNNKQTQHYLNQNSPKPLILEVKDFKRAITCTSSKVALSLQFTIIVFILTGDIKNSERTQNPRHSTPRVLSNQGDCKNVADCQWSSAFDFNSSSRAPQSHLSSLYSKVGLPAHIFLRGF